MSNRYRRAVVRHNLISAKGNLFKSVKIHWTFGWCNFDDGKTNNRYQNIHCFKDITTRCNSCCHTANQRTIFNEIFSNSFISLMQRYLVWPSFHPPTPVCAWRNRYIIFSIAKKYVGKIKLYCNSKKLITNITDIISLGGTSVLQWSLGKIVTLWQYLKIPSLQIANKIEYVVIFLISTFHYRCLIKKVT